MKLTKKQDEKIRQSLVAAIAKKGLTHKGIGDAIGVGRKNIGEFLRGQSEIGYRKYLAIQSMVLDNPPSSPIIELVKLAISTVNLELDIESDFEAPLCISTGFKASKKLEIAGMILDVDVTGDCVWFRYIEYGKEKRYVHKISDVTEIELSFNKGTEMLIIEDAEAKAIEEALREEIINQSI